MLPMQRPRWQAFSNRFGGSAPHLWYRRPMATSSHTTPRRPRNLRRLVIVFGDQLDRNSAVFDDFDPACDCVWMAEAVGEVEHVWTHKVRAAFFLSAMRHFRDDLHRRGYPVCYHELGPRGKGPDSLHAALAADLPTLAPTDGAWAVCPGEYRVKKMLEATCGEAGVDLHWVEDRHFLCSLDEFNRWADGRKQLVMEFFYREMRKRTGVLMEGRKPVGGEWNFDRENRESFGRDGPPAIPAPRRFPPDARTRDVFNVLEARFGSHPGSLASFDWPVTPEQAGDALDDFVEHRLPDFGRYQDALWTGEPFLFHSRLSAALNCKLLHPRDVIDRAVEARCANPEAIPLSSLEGFVRQILGWREYVRGIYWRYMPEYLNMNAMEAAEDLPAFYWTGDTEMACLRDTIGQTLDYGYAHHIQRLMVTGLFALLYGVDPQQVHAWYLAVYLDAVEWVELPNTLGMSQFGDGGIMASKPYVASGKYIQRMSNYCASCRFRPDRKTGEEACPFTVLYWDYLQRHRNQLQSNRRMQMQLRNLDRLEEPTLRSIRARAAAIRESPP